MFGGFVGYNAQYENVVLGFEANYMHGTFTRQFDCRAEPDPHSGVPAATRYIQTFRSDGAMTRERHGHATGARWLHDG